jgi:VanZ family protein
MKNYFKFHFPWQFVMIAIFTLSGISNEDLPDLTFHVWDKFLHFIAFGVLGILIYRSFSNTNWGFIAKNATILSILLSIIYGACDEFHQYYVPGRFASFSDWIADMIGAIFFILLYRWIHSSLIKNQNTGNLESTGR